MLMLDRACRYISLGWPVFPIAPGTKRPLAKAAHPPGHPCKGECGAMGHGLYDATLDPSMVARWWEDESGANVGLRAGVRWWVLDVDAKPPKGGGLTGFEMLALLEAEHGPLPETLTVSTPSGGQHRYFSLPTDRTIGSRARIKAPDGRQSALDVRGVGGYVVGEPSVVDGKPYALVLRTRLVAAPAWLLDLVAPPKPERKAPTKTIPIDLGATGTRYGQAALANACRAVLDAPEGGRHQALFAAAAALGNLVAGCAVGLSALACEEALCAAGISAGKPHREVIRTVRDGLTTGAQTPRVPELRHAGRSAAPEPEPSWQEAPPPDHDGPLPDDTPPEKPNGEHLTDYGNALRLVRLFGSDFLWAPTGACDGWLTWDGRCWRADDLLAIERLAKKIPDVIREEGHDAATRIMLAHDPEDERPAVYKKVMKAYLGHAKASEGAARIAAMIKLAKSEPPIGVRRADLDTDPMIVNTPSTTIHLGRAEWWDHRREDRLTRMAGVRFDPEASCPTWIKFLKTIMDEDDETVARRAAIALASGEPDPYADGGMVGYLQRMAGYAMTGSTKEHAFFILYGTGSNGKSTLVETVRYVLGEYAKNVPAATFAGRREGSIPNDLAMLDGVRLVTTAETKEGGPLDEALVKVATGGDPISARFMRAEWFEFTPRFKIWMSTNHKPVIRGVDHGIWRRIRLVPFAVTIADKDQDKSLPAKLRAEAPGILCWMVEGCAKWHDYGLQSPAVMATATKDYRAEMDILADFLEEWTEKELMATTPNGQLFAAFSEFCEENGERQRTHRWFSLAMQNRGFKQSASRKNGRAWADIKLTRQPKAKAFSGWGTG